MSQGPSPTGVGALCPRLANVCDAERFDLAVLLVLGCEVERPVGHALEDVEAAAQEDLDAANKISLARFSSRFYRSSSLIRFASSVAAQDAARHHCRSASPTRAGCRGSRRSWSRSGSPPR